MWQNEGCSNGSTDRDLTPYCNSIADIFVQSLPEKPYCSDVFEMGMRIEERTEAVRYRHIQLTHPYRTQWLTFDIDRDDAYFAAEDANPMATRLHVTPLGGLEGSGGQDR